MVTIKENRTGRITKVSRQFANVFIRLGTHARVEAADTRPTRKVAAEIVVEKRGDPTESVAPKRKYTRRKKQTDTDS